MLFIKWDMLVLYNFVLFYFDISLISFVNKVIEFGKQNFTCMYSVYEKIHGINKLCIIQFLCIKL